MGSSHKGGTLWTQEIYGKYRRVPRQEPLVLRYSSRKELRVGRVGLRVTRPWEQRTLLGLGFAYGSGLLGV